MLQCIFLLVTCNNKATKSSMSNQMQLNGHLQDFNERESWSTHARIARTCCSELLKDHLEDNISPQCLQERQPRIVMHTPLQLMPLHRHQHAWGDVEPCLHTYFWLEDFCCRLRVGQAAHGQGLRCSLLDGLCACNCCLQLLVNIIVPNWLVRWVHEQRR